MLKSISRGKDERRQNYENKRKEAIERWSKSVREKAEAKERKGRTNVEFVIINPS